MVLFIFMRFHINIPGPGTIKAVSRMANSFSIFLMQEMP